MLKSKQEIGDVMVFYGKENKLILRLVDKNAEKSDVKNAEEEISKRLFDDIIVELKKEFDYIPSKELEVILKKKIERTICEKVLPKELSYSKLRNSIQRKVTMICKCYFETKENPKITFTDEEKDLYEDYRLNSSEESKEKLKEYTKHIIFEKLRYSINLNDLSLSKQNQLYDLAFDYSSRKNLPDTYARFINKMKRKFLTNYNIEFGIKKSKIYDEFSSENYQNFLNGDENRVLLVGQNLYNQIIGELKEEFKQIDEFDIEEILREKIRRFLNNKNLINTTFDSFAKAKNVIKAYCRRQLKDKKEIGVEPLYLAHNMIANEETDPVALYDKKEIKEVVGRALNNLTSHEKFAVINYFGLNGENQCTFREIAEQLDLSVTRIGQILSSAMTKLRNSSFNKELKQFVEEYNS
ncbi:MAG: sigma factor-like helix-turn-helix DNA-binding protein [Candidatus Onthoplasma sp.]